MKDQQRRARSMAMTGRLRAATATLVPVVLVLVQWVHVHAVEAFGPGNHTTCNVLDHGAVGSGDDTVRWHR